MFSYSSTGLNFTETWTFIYFCPRTLSEASPHPIPRSVKGLHTRCILPKKAHQALGAAQGSRSQPPAAHVREAHSARSGKPCLGDSQQPAVLFQPQV